MNLTLPRFFWSEYRKRRKKSSLITFALFWGTLSVLLLMAFGQGLTTQFQDQLQRARPDADHDQRRPDVAWRSKAFPKGRAIRIDREDIAYLRDRIPEILLIAPESYNGWPVTAEGKEVNRTVHGTTAEFAALRTQVAQPGGRFLDADDVAGARKVAFLGWNVARDLFGTADPVGKQVVINRVPFTVVGVLKKKLQDSMYQGPDADQIYVPFSAFLMIDNQPYLDRVHIRPREAISPS